MIVKFCGLQREEDIKAVNGLMPDMAGFILDKSRRRYVAPDRLCELRSMLDPKIKAVGVFVDEDIDQVEKLLKEGLIDIAQLHGKETPEYIRELKKRTGAEVIKAFALRNERDIIEATDSPADLVLLDSPGGGTGEAFEWGMLTLVQRPFILAGGLNAGNVNEAIETIRPYGVDVSSGIETDGVKDRNKMEAFMAAVRKG